MLGQCLCYQSRQTTVLDHIRYDVWVIIVRADAWDMLGVLGMVLVLTMEELLASLVVRLVV